MPTPVYPSQPPDPVAEIIGDHIARTHQLVNRVEWDVSSSKLLFHHFYLHDGRYVCTAGYYHNHGLVCLLTYNPVNYSDLNAYFNDPSLFEIIDADVIKLIALLETMKKPAKKHVWPAYMNRE